MEHVDQIYLQLIRNYCIQSEEKVDIPENEWNILRQYADKHFMAAAFIPYMEAGKSGNTAELKKQLKMLLYNYYQIEHFTQKIVS